MSMKPNPAPRDAKITEAPAIAEKPKAPLDKPRPAAEKKPSGDKPAVGGFSQRGFVDRNLAALAVGVMTCGVLVLDQIWYLFDLPRFSGPSQWSRDPATLWIWVYTVGLLLAFAAGLYVLWRRTHETDCPPLVVRRPAVWIGLAVTGAVVSLALTFASESLRLSMGSAMFLSSAWAVWLVCQRWLQARVARGIRVVLVAVTFSNVIGETVWTLAYNYPVQVSFRPYTLWAVCHLLFCLCAAARIIDVWQSVSRLPIRGAIVTLLLVAPLALRSTTVANVSDALEQAATGVASEAAAGSAPSPAAADQDRWCQALLERLEAAPDDQDCPYLFVAASGGGSRAALFTALVYEHLHRIEVDGNEPHKHLALISSVSGGSLASAEYVQNAGVGTPLETPTGFTQTEIDDWIERELRCFHEPDSSLYNEYHRAFEKDQLARYLARAFVTPEAPSDDNEKPATPNVETAQDDAAAPAEKKAPPGRYRLSENSAWMLRQPLVNDMCCDFMAPLLRGALHPGLERGEACDLFWRTRLGLRRTIDEDGHGDRPLLLCNVTEVAKGSRLVVGFPSLPPGFFHGQRRNFRGFLDLGTPQADSHLPLSTAVRLSANFPWGFELGVVRILHGPSDSEMIAAIDGGVSDNTGIDTLRHTLAAVVDRCNEVDDDNHPACKIVDKLRQRGLIILEIDSGAKPQPPGVVARMFSASIGPVVALQNAAYASSQFASSENIAAIEKLLESAATGKARQLAWRLKSRGGAASTAGNPAKLPSLSCVQHVKVQCNHEENVMTAWALGPKDKAKVFVKFAIESQALGDNLAKCIEQQRHVNDWLAISSQLAGNRPSAQQDAALQNLVDAYESLVDESLEAGRLVELQALVRKAVSDDEYYRNIVNQVATPAAGGRATATDSPREDLDAFMAGRIERTHRASQAAGERLRFLRAKQTPPNDPSASRPTRERR